MSQDLRYVRDGGLVGLIEENRGKLGLLAGLVIGGYSGLKGPQIIREWRSQDAKNLVEELKKQGYSLTPTTGTTDPYVALTNAITAAVEQGFKNGVAQLKTEQKL